MTRTLQSGLVLLALAAVACGGGSPKKNVAPGGDSPAAVVPSGGDTSNDPGGTGGDPGGGTTGELPGHATLRLLGVENPGFDAVMVDLAEVSVEVDGAPVDVDVSRVRPMDLARADQAWDLGTFALPAPGELAHVRIVLDALGAWEMGADSGALDACGLPIEFDAPAEWLALRGHAVVHLDLARSILAENGDEAVLLPQLQIRY